LHLLQIEECPSTQSEIARRATLALYRHAMLQTE
jgi:hypothetical protein